jgi:hypothetical protein
MIFKIFYYLRTKIQLRKKAIKVLWQPKEVFICLAKSLALLIKTKTNE